MHRFEGILACLLHRRPCRRHSCIEANAEVPSRHDFGRGQRFVVHLGQVYILHHGRVCSRAPRLETCVAVDDRDHLLASGI